MVLKAKKFTRTFARDIILGIFLGWFALGVIMPTVAHADMNTAPYIPDAETVALIVSAMQNESRPHGGLPRAENAEARRTIRIPLTAYTSESWQTDSTPFITASGTHVRDGIVAANFLPIGTKVRIPELFGDKVFVVEDRMNKRYWHKMDIWMKHTPDAKQFGVKEATIEIY